MIINKKQILTYFFPLIFIAPLWGMDNKGTIRFTTNFNDNYPHLVNETLNNTNLNNFAMEQFVFNQKQSIETMNSATERGTVYLTVGSHSQNNMSEYKATKVKRDPSIHGKITVGLDQSPSKGTPHKGVLLFGSANTTNSTWKHNPDKPGTQFNFESGIEIKDDMEIITQAYNMVKSQSPLKPAHQKNTIPLTPTKMSLFGSKDTNLNDSIALRLKNAAERDKDKNELKAVVRTMNFNDPNIADQLCVLGNKAELIVDESTLTRNGTPLLQRMHNAGVAIHVFHPKEGSHAKQHAKDVIIENKDQQLYISSTANITKEGDHQRNYQIYVPNNKEVVTNAKNDMEKVKKECITLSEALQLKHTKDEKKAEKRKLQKIEAKATKKQKK